MADKKRDILEFVEQSNFEQFTPTQSKDKIVLETSELVEYLFKNHLVSKQK